MAAVEVQSFRNMYCTKLDPELAYHPFLLTLYFPNIKSLQSNNAEIMFQLTNP